MDEPWVGRIRRTGAVVVYDPTLQLPGHSQIYVYSVHRAVLRQFESAELRAIVETVHGQERETALAEFNAWKVKHAEEFLRREPLRLSEESQRLAAEEERVREAHRLRLVELGIDPGLVAVRAVAARTHRVTHCYACKQHLDNKVFLECASCGWIICTCGACGCGYAP